MEGVASRGIQRKHEFETTPLGKDEDAPVAEANLCSEFRTDQAQAGRSMRSFDISYTMRMARRTLLLALLQERSALQTTIASLEAYTAAKLRRRMVQQHAGERPGAAKNLRSLAPRRRQC
jgi:hypothetical protein